ncbi:MAG: Cof-type HAD-IIB family hydrolase [Tissierellia bacterium]|nr:Cof-type HAD-IIB family hydrolase [Tissierellia bacterium]
MKYIFFDIDGTLISYEKGISESTLNALKKLKENGHKIFLNTGRSLAEVGKGFDRLGFDGFVCAAGSYVKIGDKVIYQRTIDSDSIDKLVELLTSLKIGFGLEGEEFTYFSKEVYQGYRLRVYEALEKITKEEKREYEPYHFMIQPAFVRKMEDYYENRTNINKLLIYSGSRDQNELLLSKLPSKYHLIIYDTFAELLNAGINKATGIREVIKYYGASMEDTIALGDSLNDLDMIKEANIGIAMGNSSDEVKAVADVVASHIHEDGLYKILKELGLYK